MQDWKLTLIFWQWCWLSLIACKALRCPWGLLRLLHTTRALLQVIRVLDVPRCMQGAQVPTGPAQALAHNASTSASHQGASCTVNLSQKATCEKTLAGAQAGEKPAVLIVDGYNVVMQRLQLEAGAGAAAAAAVAARRACMADERERLVDDTRDYALSLGCRATVVFDALGNPGRAATAR